MCRGKGCMGVRVQGPQMHERVKNTCRTSFSAWENPAHERQRVTANVSFRVLSACTPGLQLLHMHKHRTTFRAYQEEPVDVRLKRHSQRTAS
jgi:hypothetical protein